MIMRQSLFDLIKRTIVYKYALPNKQLAIQNTKHSTKEDDCWSSLNDTDLSDIIYNLLIEYSFNEFDIPQNSYENLLKIALQTKLKYNPDSKESIKIGYGFHGEVLLYGMLYAMYGAKSLISRGYFYSVTENAETKGYDCYHLIEHDDKTELWFGETKFMQSFPDCIDSVFENINKALSNDYLCKNLLAIISQKDRLAIKGSKIEEIIKAWELNPEISLENEIKNRNLELVYPIFLTSTQLKDYDVTIKNAVERIDSKELNVSLNIPYSLFFIFLPVTSSRDVKKRVIEWIESKKPLLS